MYKNRNRCGEKKNQQRQKKNLKNLKKMWKIPTEINNEKKMGLGGGDE